jgi:hypothetical protein
MLLERELAMQKQLLLNGFALSILLYNGVQKAVMAAKPSQRLLAGTSCTASNRQHAQRI